MVVRWLVAQLGGEPVSDTTQSLPVSYLVAMEACEHTSWIANIPAPETLRQLSSTKSISAGHTVYSQHKVDPLLPRILDNQPHSQ